MQPTAPLALIAAILLWAVIKVGFVACAVWLTVARPDTLANLQRTYTQQAGRCYLFGVVNGVLLIFIGLALLSTKVLGLLGLLVFAALFTAIVAGYAAGYATLGHRIPLTHEPRSQIRIVMFGGLLAECAFFTPILGQLMSLLMLFRGLGAVTITLLAHRRQPATSPTDQSPINH